MTTAWCTFLQDNLLPRNVRVLSWGMTVVAVLATLPGHLCSEEICVRAPALGPPSPLCCCECQSQMRAFGNQIYCILNANLSRPIQKNPCLSVMKCICLKGMWIGGVRLDLRLLNEQSPCVYPAPARLGQRIKARCWKQVWVGMLRSCLECLFRKPKPKHWPACLLSIPEPQTLGQLKDYGFQTGKESTVKSLGQSLC